MAQSDAQADKLVDMLKKFDTAVLVTHAGNDRLHGRPMAVAEVADNGDLWFITGYDTPKMDEIRGNAHVLVSFQKNDRFVTVIGRAELVRDRAKIDAVWKEPFKIWFPDGKEDANLVLIHVSAQEAEYWDNAGLVNKVTYAFEAAGAYVSGSTPEVKEGRQHGRMPL